jgi:hypothetical protein
MPSLEVSREKRIIRGYRSSLRGTTEPVAESMVFHLSVLNVENPTGEVLLFRRALRRGDITLDYVGRDGLMFSGRLEGKSLYPAFRVIHKGPNGKPRRFDGCYIGEDFHGPVHPLVLVSRDDVRDCLKS